jgi:ABC-type glycerol-3-phosphate transport system substrate-binding protein
MKRIFFALAACALLLTAAAPQAEARGEVSIDFFYENLGDDGSWVEVADYGYAWQPDIAGQQPRLAPVLRWILGLHRCRLDLGVL